jgi:hypothetical protein
MFHTVNCIGHATCEFRDCVTNRHTSVRSGAWDYQKLHISMAVPYMSGTDMQTAPQLHQGWRVHIQTHCPAVQIRRLHSHHGSDTDVEPSPQNRAERASVRELEFTPAARLASTFIIRSEPCAIQSPSAQPQRSAHRHSASPARRTAPPLDHIGAPSAAVGRISTVLAKGQAGLET